jgi:membrane peptidoglycan carboxypeptidase
MRRRHFRWLAPTRFFTNKRRHLEPCLIFEIRTPEGKILYPHALESRSVLDQRVAYMMTNMLEGVLQNGTGIRVRALGFKAPAGGNFYF